jgi:hypothetical protein
MRVPQESEARASLSELAFNLAKQSAAFKAALPHGLAEPLAESVRSMNCYYSNLIEGHNTHPVDIDRAMDNDYSTNKQVRDLQLEAKSHICVQKWIDDGNIKICRQALPLTGWNISRARLRRHVTRILVKLTSGEHHQLMEMLND